MGKEQLRVPARERCERATLVRPAGERSAGRHSLVAVLAAQRRWCSVTPVVLVDTRVVHHAAEQLRDTGGGLPPQGTCF
jgi:hypothetical protein